ncbi:hypothetical protein EK21DRAFT_95644 [Setomelanomma holmii]|uniref:Protein kinase domain-containing protein n=1 Tax=Setomelanomma holmii TaxID=210430 RepID=A0A9P4GVK3_9PLEO|nr:hypothetical protein EK21DRAFT_95644 [Setomelanomma holmii]
MLTKRVIFAVGDEEVGEDESNLAHILERHLSYFALDLDSVHGLLQYLDDNPCAEIFKLICPRLTLIAKGFNKDSPRAPIRLWQYLDPEFKDLISQMCDLDPRRRITAEKALEHPWFATSTQPVLLMSLSSRAMTESRRQLKPPANANALLTD